MFKRLMCWLFGHRYKDWIQFKIGPCTRCGKEQQ